MDSEFTNEWVMNDTMNNRGSISPNTRVTPYEAFYGEETHLIRIQPFGCSCFVLNNDPKQKKWDDKGIPAVLVGFEDKIEAYRV